jgi:hypothetical protein
MLDEAASVTASGPARAWRGLVLGAAGVALFALAWEVFARSRLFAPALTPTLAAIGAALGRMVLDGSLFGHVAFTLYRVLSGLALAALVGIPLGMLMGRWRPVERFFLPLMSVLMPIPSRRSSRRRRTARARTPAGDPRGDGPGPDPSAACSRSRSSSVPAVPARAGLWVR